MAVTRIALTIGAIYIFVLSGLLQFYGNYQGAYLATYIIPPALVVCALLESKLSVGIKLTPVSGIITVFFAYVVIRAFATAETIGGVLLGIRIYFPIFATWAAIALVGNKELVWRWLERVLLIYPFISLPFVIHQHFVIAPLRPEIGWDAVVGTLTGSQLAGGDSAGLALFASLSILMAIHLMGTRRLSVAMGALVILVAAVDLLMGEVKSIILLLPLMLAVQRGRRFITKPGSSIILVLVILVSMAVATAVYQSLYWSTQKTDLNESISRSFEYMLDTDGVDFESGEVSRGASLSLWWDHARTTAQTLFGYGPGSTRTSEVSVGVIAVQFRKIDVGSTLVAQVLWDLGVVGLGLFTVAVLTASRRAAQFARGASTAVNRSRYSLLTASFAALGVYTLYNRSFVDLAAEQFALAMMFAMVCSRTAEGN
jgi:hypothetical protein